MSLNFVFVVLLLFYQINTINGLSFISEPWQVILISLVSGFILCFIMISCIIYFYMRHRRIRTIHERVLRDNHSNALKINIDGTKLGSEHSNHNQNITDEPKNFRDIINERNKHRNGSNNETRNINTELHTQQSEMDPEIEGMYENSEGNGNETPGQNRSIIYGNDTPGGSSYNNIVTPKFNGKLINVAKQMENNATETPNVFNGENNDINMDDDMNVINRNDSENVDDLYEESIEEDIFGQ
mmetsp:Transcript_97185/g.119032  ORF Transcript_97185/g.119032 Transcript_97185/m.119032 type:complete len:242 (+) Transcript_97185:29-754(+)